EAILASWSCGILKQSFRIENQTHPAIAENRSSRHAANSLQRLSQALDYHFLLADQLVHRQTETAPPALGHNQDARAQIFRLRLYAKAAVEAHYRQKRAADQRHLVPLVHGREHFFGRPHQLADRKHRHHKPFVAHSSYQSVDYGHSERQLDIERRARAARRANVDLAAHLFHLPAHHIHAHAAPRDGRHLLRGREAGMEDQ